MKKILIVLSGRKKDSITRQVAEMFIDKVKQNAHEELSVEYIVLKNVNVQHCIGCEQCFNTGSCVMKNDDMPGILDKMLEADSIFIATPVYLNHITGELKSFLDRMAFWTHLFRLRGKYGGVIVTTSNSGSEDVITYLKGIYNSLGIKFICAAKYIAIKGTISDIERAAHEYCEHINSDERFIVPSEMEYSFKAYRTSMKKGLYSNKEREYWKNNHMLQYSSLQEVIDFESEIMKRNG